jgi:SAM-dependent methyltransferase
MNNKKLVLDAYRDSTSITHRHILSVINTIIRDEKILQNPETIRILDSGCGNGILIYYLNKYLPLFNPDKKFIISGYDLLDHGVQKESYFEKTFSFLKENAPEIRWEERIKMIKSDDKWPFDDHSFDFVVSNQVLEHVWDHDYFFKENYRVLSEKGFSVHLFPIKELLIDGHIFLPKVHKLNSWDAIYRKVKFYSKLGFGRYRTEKQIYNNDVSYFSKVWADKIYHYCNYQSYQEISKAIKNSKLCLTTRFTFNYYSRKFREIIGFRPDFYYKNHASSKIIFYLFKHVSGICLVLFKGEYSKY